MFKFCVFDMDGTVVNTIGDIAAALNRSLAALGFAEHSEEEYCQMIGNGMEMLCRRAAPNASEDDIQKLIALYNKDYTQNCCEKSCIYDGVEAAVRELKKKGVVCAMLSNKPHGQVMEIADVLFEDGLFDEIMGQTPKFPTKPAPDSLFDMMKRHGFTKAETAYIGDSNVDIRLGKAAGVYTVGVSWGFRGEAELSAEGADAIAHNADELLKYLG